MVIKLTASFHRYTSLKENGFSLIEIIIGMVVMSIAFSIITTLVLPAEQQSADQLHQIKAAELGQSYLNEITGKAFDDNSDKSGGLLRCNESGAPRCTLEANFGAEGDEIGNRMLFDDVDDYHGYTELVGEVKQGSTESGLSSGYNNFSVTVSVRYNGLALNLIENELAKEITVVITTPLGSDITFSSYRANY